MDDTISRQAAIDELRKCRFVVDGIEKIRGLPPTEPVHIIGHWIVKHGSDAPPICDKCGYESRTTIKEVVDQNSKMIYRTGIDIKSNFCPNCGAKMER